jgi:hypothetical protein
VHNNSATSDFVISGNIVSDISDHYSQFCIIPSVKYKPTDNVSFNNKIRDFSHFSLTSLKNDLLGIDFDSLYGETSNDIAKMFSSFYNKTNKIINKHAPLKSISKRKIKQLLKPWITKGLLKSIKVKNKLLSSGNIETYKIYRNKISILTCNTINKKQYYHSLFTNNIHNNYEENMEGN